MKGRYSLKKLSLLLALPTLAGCATTAPTPGEPVQAVDATPLIEIEINQNERLALMLFSYHAARSLSGKRLRSRISLSEKDAATLAAVANDFAPFATAFEPYLAMHPLRDRELLFMVGHMAGGDIEFTDPTLLAALDDFMPVYREHFGPRHRAATSEFAAQLENQIAIHGAAMSRAVAAELGGTWREEPIKLDLVPYVSRAGAYTIPYHTVMSATREDYRDHALEMVFHEASHTSPIRDGLKPAAQTALDKYGLEAPRYWHYLQFYAVGRAAKTVLGEDYVPYHETTGMVSREGSGPYYKALDEVWDDYATLEERADAAAALVAAQMATDKN